MTHSADTYTLTITPDRQHIHLAGRGADATVSIRDRDPEEAIEIAAETLRLRGRTVEIVHP